MASGSCDAPQFAEAKSQAVKLYFSCTKLKIDPRLYSGLGYSLFRHAPFAVLYEWDESNAADQGTGWTKTGRTGAASHTNPEFRLPIKVNYQSEEVQLFKVAIHEYDDYWKMDDLEKHKLVGEAQFKLADVITAETVLTRQLMKLGGSEKADGLVHITNEETQVSKFDISMTILSERLSKKSFFGKLNPFLEIAKLQKDDSFTVVYYEKRGVMSAWFLQIPMEKLCDGDWDKTLQFSVFDCNKSGNSELIGKATCTLREIAPEMGGKENHLLLINPVLKAKKGHKYHDSGELYFFSVLSRTAFSFMDYIKSGCQFNLMVAIDFTGSNGKPSNPNSLHYNDQYKDNDYIAAIKSVATMLADYDSDKKFPVFGFGAKAPEYFQGVSYCFPLNFNSHDPEVVGIQGILDAYHYAVGQLQFDGPTILSLILDKAIEIAAKQSITGEWCYQVLLIITDGVITDMYDAIDRIVKASTLPLSIIIVGVGDADFSAMEVFNANDNPLKDRHGTAAERNIVQFVPFKGINIKEGFSLVQEVLAYQFLSYMKERSIEPSWISKGATAD